MIRNPAFWRSYILTNLVQRDFARLIPTSVTNEIAAFCVEMLNKYQDEEKGDEFLNILLNEGNVEAK